MRDQFLVELGVPGAQRAISGIGELNAVFTAWVETVYHVRVHSETGQAPLQRFLAAGPPALPSAQLLHEAFLWSHQRLVTKTATISLHGNRYEVDAALVGRKVEVVFDPFDLSTLEVRYQGRSMGVAVPHRIGRHVHPDARPDTPATPATVTGIDYLALVAAQHRAELAARINYTDLPTNRPAEIDQSLPAELAPFAAPSRQLGDGELPGQLDLTDLADQPAEANTHPERNEEPR